MSKIFVISDLHFGHQNIIKFCKRPFKNVEEMNEVLIKNWNETVKNDDTVYILGDFCYHGSNPEHFLKKLNGKKFLIAGNHDPKYKVNGLLGISTYEEIKVDNQRYILFHYPMVEWNGMHKNSIHLYGHLHLSAGNKVETKIKNSYNVNCELHDYKPVEITKFKVKK